MFRINIFNESDMPEVLAKAYHRAKQDDIAKYSSLLYSTSKEYSINTPLRLAHWLAQIGHESGELKYTEELASGRAYEGRNDLGNTQPGDGMKYKGRGLIQITGRANYTKFANSIAKPEIIDNPKLVAELPLSVISAAWFWLFGTGMGLNTLADKDNIVAITRRINGGLNGFPHRLELLENSKRAIDYHNALALQRMLNRTNRWPKLVEDGIFGPRTASVLREMQADYFLKPTGEVDYKTNEVLRRLV